VICSGTAKMLLELEDALGRLVVGNTLVVKPPYGINQKTVCEEAGRHRTSIKSSPEFAEIKKKIETAEENRRETALGPKHLAVENQSLISKNSILAQKLSEAEEALESAAEMIYRLHRQLQATEDDRLYLLQKVEYARKTSRVVDKTFTAMNFDSLASTH